MSGMTNREISFIVKMRNQATAGLRAVGGDLRRMAADARAASAQARQSIDSIGDASGRSAGAVRGLATAIRSIPFVALAAGLAAAGRAVFGAGEDYANLTNKLISMGVAAEDVRGQLRQLNEIAAASGSDLESTVTLYSRASLALSEMGASTEETERFVLTWQRAMSVGGATSAEAASATLQFSQALASGTLRGEEFNAVNEASPYLMRRLAEAMGVPVGQLRTLAMQGRITSDVLRAAMTDMAEGVDADYGRTVRTAGAAWTGFLNQVKISLGEAMSAIGGSEGLGRIIDGATEGVRVLAATLGMVLGPAFELVGEIARTVWEVSGLQLVIDKVGELAGSTVQVGDTTASVGATIVGAWRWSLTVLRDWVRWAREAFASFAAYMSEVWRGIGNGIMRPIATAFGMIERLARASGAAMRGDFEEAGRLAGNAYGDAMQQALRQYPEVRAVLNLPNAPTPRDLSEFVRDAQDRLNSAATTSTLPGATTPTGNARVQPVAPDAEGGAQRDRVNEVTESVEAQTEAVSENISIWQAMRDAARTAADEMVSRADYLRQQWTGVFQRLGDAFKTFTTTGKLDFRSLVADILGHVAEMAASRAWQQLLDVLTRGTPQAGGGIGGFISSAANFISGMFHTGGIVGQARAARAVSPAAFTNARRYHTGGLVGLSAGEVPIIAKRNEAVMPTVRLSDGSFGVRADVGGSGQTVIYNTVQVHVEGGGKDAVEIGQEVSKQTLAQIERFSRATAREEIAKAQRPGGMNNWRP
jgi:tape measure domain-containing protein